LTLNLLKGGYPNGNENQNQNGANRAGLRCLHRLRPGQAVAAVNDRAGQRIGGFGQ
jgi:hypothetical protein